MESSSTNATFGIKIRRDLKANDDVDFALSGLWRLHPRFPRTLPWADIFLPFGLKGKNKVTWRPLGLSGRGCRDEKFNKAKGRDFQDGRTLSIEKILAAHCRPANV
jgi:hypothetical protein